MTLAVKQKRKRAPATRRAPRVSDMTAAELGAFIETLIDRKLADLNRIQSADTISARAKRKAMSAAGRFHSGHKDISSNHDEYLVTSFGK